MKSGGPWNLRGLRPEARAAAREAARRNGMSVGEWLNNVIQPADEDDESWWSSDFEREPDDRGRPRPRHEERERERYREAPPPWRERDRYREAPPPWRERERYDDAPPPRRRERYEDEEDDRPVRRASRPYRQEYSPPGAPYRAEPPRRERPDPEEAPSRRGGGRDETIDRAVAEIEARQRALDADPTAEIRARQRTLEGEAAPAPEPARSFSERETQPFPSRPEPSPEPSYPPHHSAEAPFDLSGLEDQLRRMTARIETLQPNGNLQAAIAGLQNDLAAITRSLNEALPRRALESLEIEVKALAQRIDHTRQSGVDGASLAGIERGLTEVREALHGLTPAESLVGFNDAVQTLAKKVDAIIARDDPAALQQLETAIGALRGIVSHVASNDTLTKVAEDVRALSAKVDGLANSASSLPALTALENRIDTLAGAINASTEAGHAVPRELEKLLTGLIEKLEWVQLTHTDHTALAHLEDRIATLVKRLDVSDARLGLLEGVERGLADLLVYIEQLRGGSGAGAVVATSPATAGATVHDVAEIKEAERRTQDTLEDMHGTVEQVVDRLAMIESDLRGDNEMAASREPTSEPAVTPPVALVPEHAAAQAPDVFDDAAPLLERESEPEPHPAPPSQRLARARMPIDPSLPPDHPLEPGSATGRARALPSAADRIAASEAAVGSKPPVIPDPGGGKPDFIAAARRAAKAAAGTVPEEKANGKNGASSAAPTKKLSERIRTLAVAGAVVVIIVGGFHIVSRLFEDGGASAPSQTRTEPPRVLSEPPRLQNEPKPLPAEPAQPPQVQAEPPVAAPAENAAPAPAVIPVPPADSAQSPASPPPSTTPGPETNASTGRQSSLHPAGARGRPDGAASALPPPTDITGSLPKSPAPHGAAIVGMPASADKLPVAIGGSALRSAALAGDPHAAYEVAIRFAEGRVVPTNNEEAARWFDVAARKGVAPAQFRLGALYEKGLGVRKDLAMARDLYRAAADKGHGKAMHNLAVLYAEGIDGKADYRTAAQWFRKAADRGISDSQYNLAVLYARGVGVEQSFAESYKWFFLAARDGDSDAAQKRDEVATHLDPSALETARAAAEKWTPLPQPSDAVTVKGAWDAPADAAPAAKPKTRSPAKAAASDPAKVN
jgi:localization factor PodJL